MSETKKQIENLEKAFIKLSDWVSKLDTEIKDIHTTFDKTREMIGEIKMLEKKELSRKEDILEIIGGHWKLIILGRAHQLVVNAYIDEIFKELKKRKPDVKEVFEKFEKEVIEVEKQVVEAKKKLREKIKLYRD